MRFSELTGHIWYASQNGHYWDILSCAESEVGGEFGVGYSHNPCHASVIMGDKECEASVARLIAAAPAMLATLKIMRKTLRGAGGDAMPTLDSVIEAAEGRDA